MTFWELAGCQGSHTEAHEGVGGRHTMETVHLSRALVRINARGFRMEFAFENLGKGGRRFRPSDHSIYFCWQTEASSMCSHSRWPHQEVSVSSG